MTSKEKPKYNKIGNVIEFPVEKAAVVPEPLARVIEGAEVIINTDIQITAEDLCFILFEGMAKRGFRNITKDRKEIALMSESIRSMLCKQRNMHHPFHELAEKLFSFDEETNTLYFETKVNSL